MMKVVDGVEVEMTPEEEAEFLASVSPPEPQVPHSVSMRQARLALLGAGLLDMVEGFIQGADRATQIEWDFATDIWRDRDLVTGIGSALGLSSAEIDALFIAAKAIP